MAGRPTKYKTEYCQQLLDHMSKGYTVETFAAEIGVSRSTVYLWAKEYEEFSDTIKKGKDLSLKWWIDAGRAGMMGLGRDPATQKAIKINFNATVWIFMMKNMHGWRDKQEITHTGADGGPIKYENVSVEEIKSRFLDNLSILGIDSQDDQTEAH